MDNRTGITLRRTAHVCSEHLADHLAMCDLAYCSWTVDFDRPSNNPVGPGRKV